MQPLVDSLCRLSGISRLMIRRLLTIGANRLGLLRVEVQEERGGLLQAILLAFGAAVLGLLAGIALTAMIVILFFDLTPVAVLLGFTALYGAAAALLSRRLIRMMRTWESFPASLGQLRKDRACLEKIFE